MTNARLQHRGFTLVELLIVVAIIGVLIGIIFPTAARLRGEAKVAVCQHNLRQIGAGLLAYATDNRRTFPEGLTVGNYAYRMEPGRRKEGDIAALPETYGLAAVLHGIRPQQPLSPTFPPAKYLDARGGTWVCPGGSDNIVPFGNTYAFNINAKPWTVSDDPDKSLVWDNFTYLPGLSGFRGPFGGEGYSVKAADRVYPHRWTGKGGRGSISELHVGMYVEIRELKGTN